MWNGSNPKLTRSKFNLVAVVVAEDNLIFLGKLGPGTFDGLAVLEDDSVAATDGGDIFVIVVRHKTFSDDHGDDNFGIYGDEVATVGLSVGLIEAGGTIID